VAGDFVSELAADTLNGVYIGQADDPTATTKVAKRRLINQTVSPKMFGAKGDSTENDTAAAQGALSQGGRCVIDSGIYMVDATTRLYPVSNSVIEFLPGAEFHVITNAADSYAVFQLVDKENVTLINPVIKGDKDTHTGTTGEHGLGIRILSSKNIKVFGGKITKCWGDGAYVGAFYEGTHVNCENVRFTDVTMDGNRRQGMSVTGLIGGTFERCTFTNTGGTAPESGVDLEPNGAFVTQDIDFINCNTGGNAGGGIELSAVNGSDSAAINNIRIINHTSDADKDGFRLIGSAGKVSCTLLNCTVKNSTEYGIYSIGGALANIQGGLYFGCGESGIYFTTGSIPNISDVTCSNNGGTAGLYMREGGRVINSLFSENYSGIYIAANSTSAFIKDCEISNNEDTGLNTIGADTKLLNNYIHSNSKETNLNAHNVESYGDNAFFEWNVIRAGDNANKPQYGIRTTGNSDAFIINNDALGGGATADIFIATLTNAVIKDNRYRLEYGTTSDRPSGPDPGDFYFDNTLDKPVWYKSGGEWVDATGSVV